MKMLLAARLPLLVSIASIYALSNCGLVVRAQDPGCATDRLEECTQNLMRYSNEDVPVPTTEQEVLDNCEIIKNGSRCIRSYFSKCAPSLVKQMTKVAMAGVSRTINKNCSPKGVRELLKHRDCIADVRGSIKSCYKELVKDAFRIKESPRTSWHPLTCCFISKFHECNGDAIRKVCKEDSQEYYIQESSKLMDELMELFCPASYRWGTDDCTAATADLPEPNMPTDKTPTILPLLVDMMKQFAQN